MRDSEFHVPSFLPQWAERSLRDGRNILVRSNQGTVLHFREAGIEFLVKTAMGTGPVRRARETTLHREFRAYERMKGLPGVPRCHGLVEDKYLVLERVRGTHYRDADFEDRDAWFDELLSVIRGFHDRGVAHGDLKSKANLLMTHDQHPCVVDFGTSVLYRDGLHPLNNALFDYLRRLDLNAWVKHKYHGRYQDASPRDAELLDYSRFESLLRRYRKWKKRRG